MKKNTEMVRVVDEHGTEIGYTYPKRAKGLVKKRRAKFVTDREICLDKPSLTYENMEDNEMDEFKKINYLTFSIEGWYADMDAPQNRYGFNQDFKGVWDKFMISNPLADAIPGAPNMVEALSVGTFDWNRLTRVAYGPFQLEPETDYQLVFWLNGGENDRSDETCNLEIFYLSADQSKYTNRICCCLNRNNINPLKKYKGWEYYSIPFRTDGLGFIKLRFVADRAPLAIIAAEAPDAYEGMKDVPDPFEGKRPQRHNIFFEDGWPNDTWYSTAALRKNNPDVSVPESAPEKEKDESIQELSERVDLLTEQLTELTNRFRELEERLQKFLDAQS